MRPYVSEKFSELSARETLPCRFAQCSQAMGLLRFHRHSKPEALAMGRLLCFYLLIRQMWGFLMPSSPQLDPMKHHLWRLGGEQAPW